MSDTPAKEQCEICGQDNTSVLETHHIVPQRYGGSDRPENLVKLCGSCHNAIEEIYDDGFYQRLSTATPQFGDPETDTDLGYEINPRNSPDRKISRRARHVEMEEVVPAKLADWGILDEDDVTRVKMTYREYIEDRREALEQQKEQPDEDSNLLKRATDDLPVNLSEHLDELEEQIEAGELDPGEEIDVTGIYVDREITVIHCGYCDTVFPEWEHADAAKHLQIEHHIDDPYDTDWVYADDDPLGSFGRS